MRLTISEICEAVQVDGPMCDDVVTGVTWDSREVKPGDLYVALPGERVDGHDFAGVAVEAGAVAVLATHELAVDVPVIVVPDTAKAFTALSAFWRKRLRGVVIGLTGSTGKTTTKNLVRDVLTASGSVVATQANQNNELGVPRTLLAADADTRCVVVEMGMRGQGQIASLCAIAEPDWGLISNVGESHIELLGSRLNIAHAKAELFSALGEGGIAFVNATDDYAKEVCAQARLSERGVHVVLFDGSGRGCAGSQPTVWAGDIVLDGEGCPTFTMNASGFAALGRAEADGAHACSLMLRGMHNVSNACSAAAVGIASGMSLAACCAALAQAAPERGRQQVHHTESGITVVDDSYNANPDSMGASLRTFAAMDVRGRRIAVLGDMLELGSFSCEAHERMGALAAQLALDELVCVGELSRSIADAAVRAGMSTAVIHRCDDAAQALAEVQAIVESGDAVLVKASHSIGLDFVVEGLVG